MEQALASLQAIHDDLRYIVDSVGAGAVLTRVEAALVPDGHKEYAMARRLRVLRMREDEQMTFREIGQRHGVHMTRARAMYWQAKRDREREKEKADKRIVGAIDDSWEERLRRRKAALVNE